MLKQQQNELDEYHIYSELAKLDSTNKELLLKIAQDELRHYNFWKNITKRELKPRRWRILWYLLMAKIFGLSFALKLMEKNEENAKELYIDLAKSYPQAKEIYEDELRHEKELLALLKDEKLKYAGAMVLGMNDALVELTGTLTGLALAFANAKYVGLSGVIMGIAASFSMAASAYLEAKESEGLNPLYYALYTGVSYVITTMIVVFPFFIFETKVALGVMFLGAALAIVLYNYYIAVAKDEDFFARVKEMFLITFGVAAMSFVIGYLVNRYFGIEI